MSAFRVTVGANVHARRRIVSSCKGTCSINSHAVRHVGRTVESRAGKAPDRGNDAALDSGSSLTRERAEDLFDDKDDKGGVATSTEITLST